MNIVVVSFSDLRGGAAKAALRIKNALGKIGVETRYIVAEKKLLGNQSEGPAFFDRIRHFFLRLISYFLLKLMKTQNQTKHSLNLFSSSFVLKKTKDADILHLHWINNDTLSISALPKLTNERLTVITLHDEWFYCGAEHYASLCGNGSSRFVDGYNKNNSDVKWIDLNRFVWRLKQKHFGNLKKVVFTVPSTWLYNRAKSSALLFDKTIHIVPNPIPTRIFFPKEVSKLKCDYGINENDFVIAFGAIDALSNPIKGHEKLRSALDVLNSRMVDSEKCRVKLLVFGGRCDDNFGNDFHAIQFGHVSEEEKMAEIYNAASITVVPSLVESFGQVAAESLACSTPVVAFDYSGLTDIVEHRKSGYLAQPYDVTDLADGIMWLFAQEQRQLRDIGEYGRLHVEKCFSEVEVAKKFKSIYFDSE